MTKAS